MFGGDGKPTERMREFTLIEQRMIRKFASDVLSNLQQAWKTIDPILNVCERIVSPTRLRDMAEPATLANLQAFAETLFGSARPGAS